MPEHKLIEEIKLVGAIRTVLEEVKDPRRIVPMIVTNLKSIEKSLGELSALLGPQAEHGLSAEQLAKQQIVYASNGEDAWTAQRYKGDKLKAILCCVEDINQEEPKDIFQREPRE